MSVPVIFYNTADEAERARRHLQQRGIEGVEVAEPSADVFEVTVPQEAEPAARRELEDLEEDAIEDFF